MLEQTFFRYLTVSVTTGVFVLLLCLMNRVFAAKWNGAYQKTGSSRA